MIMMTMRNIHISLLKFFDFLEIRLWEGPTVLMGINIVTLRLRVKPNKSLKVKKGVVASTYYVTEKVTNSLVALMFC